MKTSKLKLTPIERELDAMSNKLFLVKKIIRGLLEEKEQWDPQWRDQAAAEAAGYNQALVEIRSLKAENARMREALEKISTGGVGYGVLASAEERMIVMAELAKAALDVKV